MSDRKLEFCTAQGINPDNITHFVHVGSRGACEFFAVGYWSKWAYTHGTVTHDGDAFTTLRCAHDMDIDRVVEVDGVRLTIANDRDLATLLPRDLYPRTPRGTTMIDWIDGLRESLGRPRVEPIHDDCLPFNGDADKIADFLAGPKLDADGKIVGGVWAGMTPDEVIADRDAYNRATGGDGRMW